MTGSTWTRRAVAVLAAALLGFVLACNGGAPDNPTPEQTTTPSPYAHPAR